MNLRTYQATTMSEALADVKRDLGRDAVILHTRNFRKGGLLGLIGGKRVWEVTAAPNLNVVPRIPRASRLEDESPASGVTAPAVPAETIAPAMDENALPPSPLAGEESPASDSGTIGRQMGELRTMVEKLLNTTQTPKSESELPGELRNIRKHLIDQDVDEELAWELVNQLRLNLTGREMHDRGLARQKLGELIGGRISTAGNSDVASRRVVALIGPTGVGKTTTIAKLAANFKLRENKSVGLITIDTYRIAAVDQLRAYAEIIEVPIEAVLTPAELQKAVQAMADKDVVLIDTAGRSQNNTLRLNQLRGFLTAANPDEVHLVLSATANRKAMRSTLEHFSPLGVNRVILTKLDEAETFGAILTASTAGRAMLSYVTTGQDVPDDIAPADASRLARSILEGSMQPCR